MSNNQENKKQEDEILGLGVSDQGQNLGGGKEQSTATTTGATGETQSGNDTVHLSKGGEFNKTNQEITQAQPGQTMTSTNQGSSNA